MRGFWSRREPSLERVLLIESCRQQVSQHVLPLLYNRGARLVDLFTCYPAPPATYQPERGNVFSVQDARGRAARQHLLKRLVERGYTAVAIVCSGDDIMTPWKWWVAATMPVPVLIFNDRAQRCTLGAFHWRQILDLLSFDGADRASLSIVADWALYPFTLAFLVAYGAAVHVRRMVRKPFLAGRLAEAGARAREDLRSS